MPKINKNNKLQQPTIADLEYNRLITLYKDAGVDSGKLAINDKLIRKVAELYQILENIKDLPTIRFDPTNPGKSVETAAGKVRVKYMAQYTTSMMKLNKDMFSLLNSSDDDGDLDEYDE